MVKTLYLDTQVHTDTISPVDVCAECDLLLRAARLRTDQLARCPRCGAELERGTAASMRMALAAAVTGAQLWLLMNLFPLVRLTAGGMSHDTTLTGAALSLLDRGMPALALLVFVTAVAAPACEIVLAIYVLGRLDALRRSGRMGALVRWLSVIRRWNMVDVFLLGCMVAIVKLSHMAQLITGPALWACAGLIPLLSLMNLVLEPRRLAGAHNV